LTNKVFYTNRCDGLPQVRFWAGKKQPAVELLESCGGKQPRSCSQMDFSVRLFCFLREHMGFDSAAWQT
jgi:hypothetical protein